MQAASRMQAPEHTGGRFVEAATAAALRGRTTNIGAALSGGLFILLIVFNIIRTLRHAMWRDELQIWMLAANSPSLWSLWLKLKYEGHPGLWHALVWLITRITSNPLWMQVLHTGLALGVWIIVYRWSPFSRLEKILLLLSYFLFWQYFVVSRSYVLIALIAFAFILLREKRPRPEFILWLLLGLLANVQVLGAIWSICLAVTLGMDGLRRKSVPIAGAGIYLILLIFAIATMMHAADYGPWGKDVRFSIDRLNDDVVIPLGAFVPFSFSAIREAVAFIMHPGSVVGPEFWDLTPLATAHVIRHPVRMALVYAAPIVVCWLTARDPWLVVEFAAVYVGSLLFANIWDFPGGSWHHGVIFLAFIAAVWSARSRHSPSILSSWLFMGILIVNACGGVLSLASELKPFSEGYNAAAWIKRSDLTDAFLIGSHDAKTSSVTAYLGRPIYYLECQCSGTFIVWNDKRQSFLSPAEFGRRLSEAVNAAGRQDTILIRSRPVQAEDLKSSAPNLSVTLLQSFTDSIANENFWIYRVSVK
jgi:hypothetical protein